MEHNIPELVAQLTLEEKAGLCSGADFWHTKAVERLGIPTLMVSDGPHGLRTQDPERDDPNPRRTASSAARCAAATLNITPKTRCWPVSWPLGTSMAYRARGLVPPSSILPPTARSTAA